MGLHASMSNHSYSGLIAEFCPINFTAQKRSRAEFSTFEDVVENSYCGKDGSKHDIIRVDLKLKEVVRLATKFNAYVAENINRIRRNNIPTILDFKGVIFHESRCGSVLAAKSMMALDPTRNRVYNEPGPPELAMRICHEEYSICSVKAAANLMKDVVYMMG